MADVNKVIEKVSKRNLVYPYDFYFKLDGKQYKITLYRHYRSRDVSVCNRANCNARGNCCHYVKVDGVGLCCSLSDYYDLRLRKDLSHCVASFIDHTDEEKLGNSTQNILDIISGKREAEIISPHQ